MIFDWMDIFRENVTDGNEWEHLDDLLGQWTDEGESMSGDTESWFCIAAGYAGSNTLDAEGVDAMGKGMRVRRGSFAVHWQAGEGTHAP